MTNPITQHLDLWTSALLHKKSGRGGAARVGLYGIKKLRELILELAVRGKLVPQSPTDEPARGFAEPVTRKFAYFWKNKVHPSGRTICLLPPML